MFASLILSSWSVNAAGRFLFQGASPPRNIGITPALGRETEIVGARYRTINNKSFRIFDERFTPYALEINMEGYDLGRIDRKVDPNDGRAIVAELKRFLATLTAILGDTSSYTFDNIRLTPLFGGGQKAQVIKIQFQQLVHGARLGAGTVVVDEDRVIRLHAFLGDPTQPNLKRESWSPPQTLRDSAKKSILHGLGREEIEQSSLESPELFFRIADENGSVMPIYQFYYEGYIVQVNALTLETEFLRLDLH